MGRVYCMWLLNLYITKLVLLSNSQQLYLIKPPSPLVSSEVQLHAAPHAVYFKNDGLKEILICQTTIIKVQRFVCVCAQSSQGLPQQTGLVFAYMAAGLMKQDTDTKLEAHYHIVQKLNGT